MLALVALAGCGSDGEERRPTSADVDRRLLDDVGMNFFESV